ncbi:hypothetical protein JYU06_03525, partial [Desulfotalea psychrophila]|nr:hypothetical protein [Desulfotalea psychrophila]
MKPLRFYCKMYSTQSRGALKITSTPARKRKIEENRRKKRMGDMIFFNLGCPRFTLFVSVEEPIPGAGFLISGFHWNQ